MTSREYAARLRRKRAPQGAIMPATRGAAMLSLRERWPHRAARWPVRPETKEFAGAIPSIPPWSDDSPPYLDGAALHWRCVRLGAPAASAAHPRAALLRWLH